MRNAGADDLILTLSALLHDVGKPATRTVDEMGNTRFFGHESVGREMTQQILQKLKFSQKEIDEVALLVGNHMRLGSAPVFTPTAARRLLRDLDGEVWRLLQLVRADSGALRPGVKTMNLDQIEARLEEVRRITPPNTLQSPLSGQEIMQITGLPPGKEVGRIKHLLTEKVLEGEIGPEDEEAARAVVLKEVGEGQGE